jgi:hypothetical protein
MKTMKKVTNKQVFMVVLVVVIIAVVLVYLNVFVAYTDKADALQKSNKELQVQVDDMKQYYDNMEVYRTKTSELTTVIEDELADYPADSRVEDAVMMAVSMQDVALVNFDQINIGTSESIYTVPQETVAAANIEGMTEELDFVERQVTYSNELDYTNLKKCISEIYNSPYRVGISAVTYKKQSDDTKIIDGTIDVAYYSLTGLGREYQPLTIPEYQSGTTELFGVTVTEEN